jgi:uncharacterized protein YbjT (DUF2867 family)
MRTIVVQPKLDRRRSILLGLAIASAPHAAKAAGRDIVVLGATAQSAPEIIKQGLAQGRKVTALARRPEAVIGNHPNLKIVKGDVRDPASLEAVLNGAEVVISLVGPRVDPRVEIKSMDLYSLGTTNVINAMRKKANKRLIATSSIGVRTEPKEKPTGDNISALWLWNSRKLYADMRAMEDIVRASGLEFVILRPGFMIEAPSQPDKVKYSVEELAMPGTGPIVSFADFAALTLAQVDGDQYLGKAVAIFSDQTTNWGVNLDFAAMWKMRQEQGPIDVY